MNQTIRIDESLCDKSLRLLENEITVKLKIEAHIGLTVLVRWVDAKGMVVLDQDNPGVVEEDPETDDSQKQIFSGPQRSQGPLPRAIELDGDGSEVLMLDELSAGDTITLGKALKQGGRPAGNSGEHASKRSGTGGTSSQANPSAPAACTLQ